MGGSISEYHWPYFDRDRGFVAVVVAVDGRCAGGPSTGVGLQRRVEWPNRRYQTRTIISSVFFLGANFTR